MLMEADNIFLKSNSPTPKSYKLAKPFSDHNPLLVALDKITIKNQDSIPKMSLAIINYKIKLD